MSTPAGLPIQGPLAPDLPVFVVQVPGADALNDALLGRLRDMSASTPSVGSNRTDGVSYFDNKWISDRQLHRLGDEHLDRLVAVAEQAGALLAGPGEAPDPLRVFAMWSIVSQPGMSGSRHAHGGMMSTAYYVDAGSSGAEDGGLIEFYREPEDPEPAARIRPSSGLLLLFPSHLRHSVSRYQGSRPRVVISMNLNRRPRA